MTGLLIAPDLDRVVIKRQGIFTLPAEDALVRCGCNGRPCSGVDASHLPQEWAKFETTARRLGDMFIERQAIRGFEWVSGSMRLHGPFPSYDFNRHLADVESEAMRQAGKRDKADDMEHPERTLGIVFEREAFNPYVDYVFVASFLFKDRMTDLELPDGN